MPNRSRPWRHTNELCANVHLGQKCLHAHPHVRCISPRAEMFSVSSTHCNYPISMKTIPFLRACNLHTRTTATIISRPDKLKARSMRLGSRFEPKPVLLFMIFFQLQLNLLFRFLALLSMYSVCVQASVLRSVRDVFGLVGTATCVFDVLQCDQRSNRAVLRVNREYVSARAWVLASDCEGQS